MDPILIGLIVVVVAGVVYYLHSAKGQAELAALEARITGHTSSAVAAFSATTVAAVQASVVPVVTPVAAPVPTPAPAPVVAPPVAPVAPPVASPVTVQVVSDTPPPALPPNPDFILTTPGAGGHYFAIGHSVWQLPNVKAGTPFSVNAVGNDVMLSATLMDPSGVPVPNGHQQGANSVQPKCPSAPVDGTYTCELDAVGTTGGSIKRF